VIYLDTNVLLYATLSKVDNKSQQEIAISILKELVTNNSLILSNLSLLEYSFVMQKANEDITKTKDAIRLFNRFVKSEKDNFNNEIAGFFDNQNAFKNSFDLYHIIFANSYNCQKLITFDKGFKKFKDICSLEIEIIK
jgi:predicted nucleic acid-binding protein